MCSYFNIFFSSEFALISLSFQRKIRGLGNILILEKLNYEVNGCSCMGWGGGGWVGGVKDTPT